MAITREKKEDIFAKVKDAVTTDGAVVFVNFKGLPVADTQDMRAKLRNGSVSYYVAKKTLVKRALAEASVAGEQPVLPGELALAWSSDLVAPAREVAEFAKTHKEQVSIMGGIFEGRYMSAAEMTEIALIPSQQTLYAQFVNIINSPIQGFVMSLDQIAQKREAAAA